MAKTPLRHSYIQTNGRPIYLYDHDVVAVASVVTEKHGACLVLKMRGIDDVWIKDDVKHRALLMLATPADDHTRIKGTTPSNTVG